MTAANYSFQVDQGATFRASVTLTADGAPYSLTGFASSFAVVPENSTTKTTYESVISGNTINLHIPAAQTTLMGATKNIKVYSYEVSATAPSGDVVKVVKGLLSVIGSF